MTVEDDKFPAGMRVLVVDDDPTCLKLMEGLLHKCQYQVTTTNQAKEALRMLKENKNMFDIVISDVQMPDMDGFKLLQLVGLEMDLPVIMLSAYGDTKLVMKGIRNGACDYLLKPVRIQELQNIWQHVVRKNKSVPHARRAPSTAEDVVNAAQDERLYEENMEENAGVDNNQDDDEQVEECGRGNEEHTTTQKKPRLFWSIELHQKFLDAVDQLGLDKAFPKKILDLMNVEGLTREKVASHLQKYRLYLRKMNAASNQEANRMGAMLGAEERHIASFGGGYGVFHSLAGPGRFSGATSSLSHKAGGMLGRVNTPFGASSMRGLSSFVLQRSQYPNSSSSLATSNQNAGLFQGIIPTRLQHSKATLLCPPTTSSVLNTRGFCNPSSINVASPVDPNTNNSNKCQGNWGSCDPSLDHPFKRDIPFHSCNNVSGDGFDVQKDVLEYLSRITSLEDSRAENQVANNNVDHLGYVLNSCNTYNSASSSVIAGMGPSASDWTMSQSNNNVYMGASPFTQVEGMAPHSIGKSNSQLNVRLDEDEDYLLDEAEILLCGSSQNRGEYLEDIVGRFLKQENGETLATGEDLGLELDTLPAQ